MTLDPTDRAAIAELRRQNARQMLSDTHDFIEALAALSSVPPEPTVGHDTER
jgi:hypothetical protein